MFYQYKGHCADHPGRDDAQDGWLAGLPGDPQILQSADYHADGQERMSVTNCRDLSWEWTNIFPNPSALKILVARVEAILRRTNAINSEEVPKGWRRL